MVEKKNVKFTNILLTKWCCDVTVKTLLVNSADLFC